MATFNNTYGPAAMMAAVVEHLKEVEMPDSGDVDIHTITLELNGQHGEFDLTVLATNESMKDLKFTGIAYRYGGVADFKEVVD